MLIRIRSTNKKVYSTYSTSVLLINYVVVIRCDVYNTQAHPISTKQSSAVVSSQMFKQQVNPARPQNVTFPFFDGSNNPFNLVQAICHSVLDYRSESLIHFMLTVILKTQNTIILCTNLLLR